MARRQDLLGVSTADTVIGSSVKLKGNVASDGDIAIDGHLIGNVKSGGNVTIGVNARIAGDVIGINVMIAGRLEGSIKSTDNTSLLETAQVNGDITTGTLQVSLGAVFIGNNRMKAAEATEVLERTEVEG